MATAVPKIIALPNPCRTRSRITATADGATIIRSDASVNIESPAANTFLRP